MRTRMFSRSLFAGIVTIALAAVPLSAQMDHSQMHGAQGGMKGMNHAAMMASTDKMMKNIDQMLSSSSATMRDLTSMQGHGQPGSMITSMQGMLDSMKLLHTQLNGIMKDAAVMGNDQAMKGFQQTCKGLEQMASSFQIMTTNVSSMLMATMASAKR